MSYGYNQNMIFFSHFRGRTGIVIQEFTFGRSEQCLKKQIKCYGRSCVPLKWPSPNHEKQMQIFWPQSRLRQSSIVIFQPAMCFCVTMEADSNNFLVNIQSLFCA